MKLQTQMMIKQEGMITERTSSPLNPNHGIASVLLKQFDSKKEFAIK